MFIRYPIRMGCSFSYAPLGAFWVCVGCLVGLPNVVVPLETAIGR